MNRRNLLMAAAAGALGGLSPRAAFAQDATAAPSADAARAWLIRWLAAFNGSDLNGYRDFVLRNAPTVAPWIDDDLAVRETSGGFELLRAETTGPGEVTAWVRDRDWDRFSRVILAAATDAKIDDISFAGAPPPAGFGIARLSERRAIDALKLKLAQAARKGALSGAVLIARDGEVLFSKGYGMADAAGRVAATPSTRFCVGSMGKMFTAVAVMQLVEQGRVRLGDTVGVHLPDYPNKAVAGRVTIEQLLTHTGGTGDIFGPGFDGHADGDKTPAQLVQLYGGRDPVFEPGSRWGYSNYGFILLGRIVETVTGRPWAAWYEERVFRPAGMSATSPSATSPRIAALPYTGATATGLKPLAAYAGAPAGGGYSTVEDLHAFATALRDGRLLNAASLRLLTGPRVEAGTSRWALGLSVRQRNGAPYYGHGGAAPGVNGDFAVYPASGYETVVLCNRGHPLATSVADYVGARLPAPAAS